jgi:hypothetical protein
MGPLQISGGVLVLASIVLLQYSQDIDENSPEMIRANKADLAEDTSKKK